MYVYMTMGPFLHEIPSNLNATNIEVRKPLEGTGSEVNTAGGASRAQVHDSGLDGFALVYKEQRSVSGSKFWCDYSQCTLMRRPQLDPPEYWLELRATARSLF